jgi:hypothetical protein
MAILSMIYLEVQQLLENSTGFLAKRLLHQQEKKPSDTLSPNANIPY